MASRELQKEGQAQLDAFNQNMMAILQALVAAKGRAAIEGGTFRDLINKGMAAAQEIDKGMAAAKGIDNTAQPSCLHCHLKQSLAVWAACHIGEELLKICAQGWKPAQPGYPPEQLIRAAIAIGGLGKLAGEVAREADEALHGHGNVLAKLITEMLEAFGYGANASIKSDPVEVVAPHEGSKLKH